MTDTINDNHVARKAGKGAFWVFLAYALSKVVVLLTTSILARLLAKDDFGLVAVAVIAINYLSVIKDLGLGVALIQRRDNVDDAANTVFSINVIVGFFLSIIVFPIAPFVADYFNEPAVVSVIRWLGTSFAINALGSVHIVLLTRELDFRKKFIPDISNVIVKGVVSIGLAVTGFGVWALVFGQIAGSVVSVIAVWLIFPWRPKIMIKKTLASAMLKFGASVFGEDILSVFIENFDYIVVGRVFGLEQLSVYTLAFRLPEMLLIGILWVIAGITYPAFSTIQDKPDEMRRGMLFTTRFLQMFAMPISLGLLLAATPIVRVVFGDEWLEVIPVLRVLALYAWIYSVGFHVGDIYKAIGRPDIQLKLTIFTLILIVPFITFGSKFGLVGVAWGHLSAALIYQSVSIIVAARFINIPVTDILKELKPSFQASSAMAPVVLATLFLTKNYSPYIQLPLVVILGAFCYGVVLWGVERENLLKMLRVVGVDIQKNEA